MRQIFVRTMVAAAVLAALGCNKKSGKAVVEEVSPVPAAGDSATALAEEPALESVGEKPPESAPSPSGEYFSETGRIVIQVAIFKSRRQSNGLVEKLQASGFPAYVASVEDPTPDLAGTWYRVRIGNFADVKTARAFGEETMRGQGYDFWVDNKSNDHKAISASEEGSYSTPSSSYSEPASSSYSEPAYTPPAEAAPAPSEPVVTPDPPPQTPPSQDAWGEPAAPSPSAPADTAKPVEGW